MAASPTADSAAKKNLVIVGGGYAGCTLAHQLRSVANVTLIDSKSYLEVNFANSRNVVNGGLLDKPCNLIRHEEWASPLPKHPSPVDIKVGIASGISEDGAVTLASGESIPYDVLVVATGASYPVFKPSAAGVTFEDRFTELKTEAARTSAAQHVLIVGGGPLGVEIAAELKADTPDRKVSLVARSGLMAGFPEKHGRKMTKKLTKLGVAVVKGTVGAPGNLAASISAATSVPVGDNEEVTEIADVDRVINTTGFGVFNTGIFAHSPYAAAIKESNGKIEVSAHFQVAGADNVFALGDIADVGDANELGYHAMNHAALFAKMFKKWVKTGKWDAVKGYKGSSPVSFLALGPKAGYTTLPLPGFVAKSMKSKDLLIGMVRSKVGVGKAPSASVSTPGSPVSSVATTPATAASRSVDSDGEASPAAANNADATADNVVESAVDAPAPSSTVPVA